MKQKIITSTFMVSVLALGAMVGPLAAAESGKDYKQSLSTELMGKNEVPAVETDASGDAVFNVSQDERSIDFVVNARNAENVTAAHLHCGEAGANGPVVVGLYDEEATDVDGKLVSGTISAPDILAAGATCGPQIRDVPQLVQAMREGKIYTNVHSTEFPNGLIRGQVGVADSPSKPSPQPMDSKFYVSSNPDGVINDKVVGINTELNKATEILSDFGAATSVQSVTLDENDTAYITIDTSASTGGLMIVDDFTTKTSFGEDDYRIVSGTNTGLAGPRGLEHVSSQDAVIVSDTVAKDVKVFADTAEGNVAPMFTVKNLGGVENRSVWDTDYDEASDTLYVAATDGTVVVYHNFLRDKGVDGPSRLIVPSSSDGTKLGVNAHGIAYVPERDALVISDVGSATDATDGQVLTIMKASTISGRTAVNLQLAGSQTMLGNPVDLEFDGQHLYVAEKSNDALLKFNDLFGKSGSLNQAADTKLMVIKPESVVID